VQPARTVLIVDDEAFFRSSVCEGISKRYGHLRLLSAGHGGEALEILGAQDVDLVVTDLKMPVVDGFELLGRLMKEHPGMPAIVMTAFGTPGLEERARSLGAVSYVEKPIDLEALGRRIEEVLRQAAGGHLQGITLASFLQLLEIERKTCTLRVTSGDRSGLLCFQDGELIHAETGEVSGPPAVYLLESWKAPEIEIDNVCRARKRTVDMPLAQLLLEGARLADEHGRGSDLQDPFPSRKEIRMGKIDDACRDIVNNVDGAVACGVVDLDTGMLLGIHNASQYTQTLNEVVAAATMDMFRGPNIGRIEQMVRAHRGIPENGDHYFQEVHITSQYNFHFAKTIRQGKAVMMLVTKKTTNIGMGWAQLKAAVPSVEPLVP
jgi:CheY-like chemotaxis protein